MEAMIQIVGMPIETFWAEMDKRYGVKEKEVDKEYSTDEAMAALGYKDPRTFRKYLKTNSILPHRKARYEKYYLHSELFKKQKFV